MGLPHLKVAYKEVRRRLAEHLIYAVVIALGVAGLVATSSFTDSLADAVNEQTKTLLGADFIVRSRQELPADLLKPFDESARAYSDQVAFNSMVQFVSTGATRLVQVRAVTGHAPFYGPFETRPPRARAALERWNPAEGIPPAIVDQTLLQQYRASVGDVIRLGAQEFEVIAELTKVAGEVAAISLVGPRIYIPQAAVDRTGLLKVGSLARYKRYYKTAGDAQTKELVGKLKLALEDSSASVETLEERREDIEGLLKNLKIFLGFSGIAALLLGLAGVSSAAFVQARRKRPNAAALLCLGATRRDVALIYGLQSLLLAMLGASAGAAVGWLIVRLFPLVLFEFMPLDVSMSVGVSVSALTAGVVIGLSGGLLFSWEALRSLALVSPMRALRTSARESVQRISSLTLMLLAGFLLLAGRYATGSSLAAVLFLAGVLGLFALIAAAGIGMLKLLHPAVRRAPRAILRQGLGNVYRPNNQSLIMILCVALLTFVISLTLLLQHSILNEVSLKDVSSQPNTVLFDIQTDQQQQVAALLRELDRPIIEEAAIISMRLRKINSTPASALLKDKRIPRWTLRREYRSTYRDHLTSTEKIIAGEFVPRVDPSVSPVPVSIEEGIADKLRIGIGDKLTFDVQGVTLETTVQSIRNVDWKQVRPNFFVVFPLGVLEQAPQTRVIATRVDNSAQSAALQQRTVERFPNISVIDITLVLSTLEAVLDKISFVLMFLGFFIVAMGAIILGGALATGKFHRVRELLVYRLLGAGYSDMRTLIASELLLLASIGIVIGLAVAFSSAAALGRLVLDISVSGLLYGSIVPAVLCLALVILLGAATIGPFRRLSPREVLSGGGRL